MTEKLASGRTKRGRGSVGSRMGELGPYLATLPSNEKLSTSPYSRLNEEWECRMFGPDKPTWLNVPQDEDATNLPKLGKKASKEFNSSGIRKVKKSKNKQR